MPSSMYPYVSHIIFLSRQMKLLARRCVDNRLPVQKDQVQTCTSCEYVVACTPSPEHYCSLLLCCDRFAEAKEVLGTSNFLS